MSRGFKRDIQATADAYRLGTLVDKKRRSFISLPKSIPGHSGDVHVLLFGDDKGPMRAVVFSHNRQRHQGINRCELCGKRVVESGFVVLIGEWDHIRNGPGERCDCHENARVVCQPCHRLRHPRTKFGSRRSAEQVSA